MADPELTDRELIEFLSGKVVALEIFFCAILETVVTLVLWSFASFYWVVEFVLSTALDSEEFYEFAQANRVLWIYPGDDDYFT